MEAEQPSQDKGKRHGGGAARLHDAEMPCAANPGVTHDAVFHNLAPEVEDDEEAATAHDDDILMEPNDTLGHRERYRGQCSKRGGWCDTAKPGFHQ